MDRVGTGFFANVDDDIRSQIGARRGRRTNAHRFIGIPDVGRQAVRFAKDGYGPNAHFSGRPHDAQCNFAPVGNEKFLNFSH